MDLGIAGKRALLTGASRGMGRACAEALAREGCEITICARSAGPLEETAEAIRRATGATVHTVAADVTTEEGRASIIAACPDPDILLNNAGGKAPGDFRDWDRDEWISAVELMMIPPILMMRATVDGMMERGWGRIVNIVSRSVKIPQLELGLSNGARSGLVGFTAGLARQTIARGVTVNNLLPGIVDSDAQREHIEGMLTGDGPSFDEVWSARAKANPAGRYGRPEEIGAWFAFICSQHSGFVTGQNLLIDGGSYPGTY
ncbi:SDR family oxidoreductase [Tropicimonas sediminicola]|uniref:3-oxoacyl-[acyl-carrier protein] reductase n=1 Tax=Tropicimonas sediminicola TaxID=1031541 RepID=A0A239D1C4_9RHOB|nr:SDR family oxidoreductase [Tropicimonas sediminicola]SNS25413.1 3-oxoacyl-[acyl-carrier protein] reductase [Tropicimonas sediminicola]